MATFLTHLDKGPSTIRGALIAGISMCSVAILLLGCVGLYLVVEDHALREFDRALLEEAQLIASEVEIEGRIVWHDWSEWFTALDKSAHSIARIQNLVTSFVVGAEYPEPVRAVDTRIEAAEQIRFFEFEPSEGKCFRGVEFEFFPLVGDEDRLDFDDEHEDPDAVDLVVEHLGSETEASPKHRIRFAKDTSSVVALLSKLITALVVGSGVMIFASALAIGRITRMVLRPLDDLVSALKGRSEEDVDTPLPKVRKLPTELQPLVTAYESLLEKMRKACQRERDFATNAAHEFRTPTAGIYATLELALRKKRTSADLEERIRKALKISEHQKDLLDRVFYLARLQSGEERILIEDVDLAQEIKSLRNLTEFGEDAADRVDWRISQRLPTIKADVTLLKMLIINLVNNAVSHSINETRIEVTVQQLDDRVVLSIVNEAAGLSEELIEGMFEPFRRGSNSSTADASESHVGIGLNICRQICDSIGADLRVSLMNEQRIGFDVLFD